MSPDSPRFFPFAFGIIALFAWFFFLAARSQITKWEEGGKTGHIHLAWRQLYDLGGKPAIYALHGGLATAMTILCLVFLIRSFK